MPPRRHPLSFPPLPSPRPLLRLPNPPRTPLRFQSTSPPNNPRINRILSRLPKFLHPYTQTLRSAPVSHVVAFLILHEITAVVPLLGLAGLFHYTDWLPKGWSEAQYINEGVQKFGRYFRRKGWFGFSNEHPSSEITIPEGQHVSERRETQIAPGARIDSGAHLEVGAQIQKGAHIEVGAQIGKGAKIGEGAHVEVGAQVGGGARIDPGAHVGVGARIGKGAHIREGIHIGDDVQVRKGVSEGANADIEVEGNGNGNGTRILVEVATAYAITKVLLPARIIFSVWATPWFARVAVRRFGSIFKGIGRKPTTKVNPTKTNGGTPNSKAP